VPRVSPGSIDRQLERLERLLTRHPQGIERAALAAEYAARFRERIHDRTLQRRLLRLARERRLVVRGRGDAWIYLPSAERTDEVHPSTPNEGWKGTYDIPLSPEGAEVRALVRRSMVKREPVGYRREFLEAYEPGRTWYLPEATRARLHEIGRTPDPDRPAGTYAREIMERLLVDLAWASSRLEGNTYSRLDTQNLIEFGQRAEGKDATEAQMILNHKNAIELLVDHAEMLGFNRRTLLALHAALSENLLPDHAQEGRLRAHMVHIGGTPYLPIAIPQVIEEHFDLVLAKAAAIPDPFEQAFFVMVHMPYLQPFSDVNKRTSRLAANIPLVVGNLCPLSFVDVPLDAYVEGTLGVYELTRVELLRDLFVWAYERSCRQYTVVRDALAQPDPIRMRYRDALSQAVRETVLAGLPPRAEHLRAWAEEHEVPADDREAFTERALALMVNLNEGTAMRYRLRPSEFHQWRDRFATRPAEEP
jgi:fido (protein-threonine AMPylation protein)